MYYLAGARYEAGQKKEIDVGVRGGLDSESDRESNEPGLATPTTGVTDLAFLPWEEAAMRIAYFTSDEVNLDWAQRWASTCGCEVIAMSPSDSPNGDCDATIYDLDFLLPTYGEEVLSVLLSRPLPSPAAVHSYNLRRHQASECAPWSGRSAQART